MASLCVLRSLGRQGLVASSFRPALRSSELSDATRQLTEGIPAKHLQRRVRIFFTCANAMQSGTSNRHWRFEFDDKLKETRWANPLMGWASSRDPLGRLRLEFETKEEAIAYAAEQGLEYELSQDNLPEQEVGDDFSLEAEIPELFYDDNFVFKPVRGDLEKLND